MSRQKSDPNKGSGGYNEEGFLARDDLAFRYIDILFKTTQAEVTNSDKLQLVESDAQLQKRLVADTPDRLHQLVLHLFFAVPDLSSRSRLLSHLQEKTPSDHASKAALSLIAQLYDAFSPDDPAPQEVMDFIDYLYKISSLNTVDRFSRARALHLLYIFKHCHEHHSDLDVCYSTQLPNFDEAFDHLSRAYDADKGKAKAFQLLDFLAYHGLASIHNLQKTGVRISSGLGEVSAMHKTRMVTLMMGAKYNAHKVAGLFDRISEAVAPAGKGRVEAQLSTLCRQYGDVEYFNAQLHQELGSLEKSGTDVTDEPASQKYKFISWIFENDFMATLSRNHSQLPEDVKSYYNYIMIFLGKYFERLPQDLQKKYRTSMEGFMALEKERIAAAKKNLLDPQVVQSESDLLYLMNDLIFSMLDDKVRAVLVHRLVDMRSKILRKPGAKDDLSIQNLFAAGGDVLRRNAALDGPMQVFLRAHDSNPKTASQYQDWLNESYKVIKAAKVKLDQQANTISAIMQAYDKIIEPLIEYITQYLDSPRKKFHNKAELLERIGQMRQKEFTIAGNYSFFEGLANDTHSPEKVIRHIVSAKHSQPLEKMLPLEDFIKEQYSLFTKKEVAENPFLYDIQHTMKVLSSPVTLFHTTSPTTLPSRPHLMSLAVATDNPFDAISAEELPAFFGSSAK